MELKGSEPYAMARMVQGDVGSGKTAVAMGAMLLAAQSGYQSALMAPDGNSGPAASGRP